MSLWSHFSSAIPVRDITNRILPPVTVQDLSRIPDLRRFTVHYYAIRRGLKHPSIQVRKSAEPGRFSITGRRELLCALEALGIKEVWAEVEIDPRDRIACSKREDAVMKARLGFVSYCMRGNNYERFRLDEGMIEHIVQSSDKPEGSVMVEYLL